jgi:hypothetical protein
VVFTLFVDVMLVDVAGLATSAAGWSREAVIVGTTVFGSGPACGCTTIWTVATFDVKAPSVAIYVKVTEPTKLTSGV